MGDKIKWYLDTDYPIAIDSYDHIDNQVHPAWKSIDKSFNLKFNSKLYQISPPPVSILDIGCGGGSFVKTILDDGNEAVGLEGSTHPKEMELIGWIDVPNNLFTCDIIHPFILHTGNHISYQFDVVTAWEVLEHIEEQNLPLVFNNIYKHLRVDGLFIMTTPTSINKPPKYGLDHHRTRKGWEWWIETIESYGFARQVELNAHFGKDWVRMGNIREVYKKIK